MAAMVELAAMRRVSVGAHPSFDDREHFGRRELDVSAADVFTLVAAQIRTLIRIAAARNVPVRHVKPHGALYNMAARDAALADAIVRAVVGVDPSLVLFGLSGSQLIAAGDRARLRVASEVFADRGYRTDGSLAPRGTPDAVVTDPAEVARRAVGMASGQTVTAVDGTSVSVKADTVCIHGDTPGAAALARAVRDALVVAGIEIHPPGEDRGRR
jgi:UPF0271 protein